ncbi:2-succinyl-6-hydroxy-2,4-cyclohexadiene-1-carboxylate synthase [Vibrio sp. ZSDE26]|uniref:Putative 2-succinyl-6-hydroxy-2,4-cyclohexadiene-1-carboxylate synthase n=1 Tax=Vibrio amylolyticus TaxID=2847292 RepID=A0A9X1XFV2_9VIBR|nr:2-succinyl-6-hydroxy-2,4-cyclohexadiene-1-carboxylate synthase [Vibrio amylolyticus]MCK6262066.1 2-succinyl-6-hydroxy-2,4-cyclohexadiene-1-carboxylate synthase [Vibrio amylolyticus]
MLHSRHFHQPHNQQKPTLVFLHGLLGSGEDWSATLDRLHSFSCITIDLPGHGQSVEMTCYDFDDCCDMISKALIAHLPKAQPIVIIGYSMGGRIAMHGAATCRFSALNLQGLVIEGGNFGLLDAENKQKRLSNDERWAERFIHEPIEQVLIDWYQQGVFSSLNHEQKQLLQLKRSANLGCSIAKVLLATSLAKQQHLLAALTRLAIPMHYVCGEKDTKFSQIAFKSGLRYSKVSGAGHNVHQECPEQFAQVVHQFVNGFYEREIE